MLRFAKTVMIFLPRNGRKQIDCFLGANKYTSFLTQIIQIFVDVKFSENNWLTILSKNVL